MLSCHLCLLISCYSLVFCLLSFDCSFSLTAWYQYIFYLPPIIVMHDGSCQISCNWLILTPYFNMPAHQSIMLQIIMLSLALPVTLNWRCASLKWWTLAREARVPISAVFWLIRLGFEPPTFHYLSECFTHQATETW